MKRLVILSETKDLGRRLFVILNGVKDLKVVNGTVVDEKSLLFKPPEGHQRFDPFNTLIHGITAADVQDKPVFKEIWPEVLQYIDGDPLVAHNAAFDLGVIREALGASNMAWPDLEYFCTLVISRKAVKGLLSYSLPYVAAALDRVSS